ncbi:MAG: helix-turn-helix transcriptional regulator [Anaerolineaceae bacterium]|nr:helix-turn-helix transcriptional regulator [Anaerolineaceae bacterium]
MSTPILATKLYTPQPRPSVVARPRLIEQLNNGVHRKLTLISAPAGFGKTTLVSEWIVGGERPFTWLSLDERDSDLTRFLAYFVAAMQKIFPAFGEQLLGLLESSQLPPTESILTSLLNEIASRQEAFVFVLDDYHVVDAPQIDQALTFMLEHLPPQMHLVITTREDPNLPLARWRVRSQLTELRANDLRFTVAETAVFLKQVMGLNLTEDNTARLEARTEGWIAGLQLAALSMQGREDISGFLNAFTGDNRYIVDYLVEEVLQRQPESTRRFLLQTAILERLNGPLCTAVTGQQESRARLEALERGNFFLIPLDDKRHWYRYHHLFAEVLHVHLVAEQPEQVAILHKRASEWHEHNGSLVDAIRHALAGRDFDRAADLIEKSVPAMRQSRQEATLLGWFQALPEAVRQNRPVLTVHYAGTLLQNGHLDGVEPLLQNAERWLDRSTEIGEGPIFVDAADFNRLPGLVAMYHAGIALIRSDVASAINYARQVVESAPETDNFLHGAASSLLGLAFWTGGNLQEAYQMFADGMAHLQRAGFISDVVGGSVTLADIRITQGRLREAMSIYKHGLQLATKQGQPALRGAADMHVGLSELYREYNDLSTAGQHLLKSQELGELNGLPKNPYRWRVALARIREAEEDLDGALDLLEEAAPLYVGDFSPNFRPVQALKTRVWIAQGRLDEALSWAREQGLSAEDDLNYLREFEHITLARLLLTQGGNGRNKNAIHEATALLERLLKFAEAGGRMGVVIEILILQALTHQLQGNVSAALAALERALKLAEPEGYVRAFLDEGAPMAELLGQTAVQGIMPGYTGKLLEAFKNEQNRSDSVSPPFPQSLIEPLSQRELDILRLFQTELSGPEIADELVIALSTVRTHTKGIYSKLNVNSRRAAVKRAIELGLI